MTSPTQKGVGTRGIDPNGGSGDTGDFASVERYLAEPERTELRSRSVLACSETAWASAQVKMRMIEQYFKAAENVSMKDIAKQLGVSESTLYRIIGRFLGSNGDMLSLVSEPRRPGRRLDPLVQEIITRRIRKDFLKAPGISISELARRIGDECSERSLERPHRNTIERQVKRIPPQVITLARLGPRESRTVFQHVGTGFHSADAPLRIIEIDSTSGDVILVDPINRRVIGRATITAALDVYSRMPLGFVVSLEDPGYLTTGLCLIHAVLPKRGWLAERGLDFEWPCEGLPLAVHVDSGKEFDNKDLRRVAERYGINIVFRRLKRSEDGGHIESFLRTVNRKLHTIDGTTFSNPQERKDYPSEKMAHLTLEELERYLGAFLAGEYPNTPHEGLGGQTPLRRWREGMAIRKSGLPTGNPRLITDQDPFCIELMPSTLRTVRRVGVEFECLKYYCSEIQEWVGSMDERHQRLPRQFRIHYDPRDIRFIYFYDPKRNCFIKVPCTDRSIGPISLLEWKAMRKAKKKAFSKDAANDLPVARRARRQMQETILTSKELTRLTRRSLTRKAQNQKNNVHNMISEDIVPKPLEFNTNPDGNEELEAIHNKIQSIPEDWKSAESIREIE